MLILAALVLIAASPSFAQDAADAFKVGRLATMIDYGELKVHIDAVYSFESAPKALARVLQKHVRGIVALALP